MEEALKKLNDQSAFLTDADTHKLMTLVSHFFVNHPVQEAREKLRELYTSWIYQSYECTDSKKIKDMLLFYIQLMSFINGCYVYSEKIEMTH